MIAHSSAKYTLTLAESWPTNFPIFGDVSRNFAQMVETMSNGRLTVRVDSKNKHQAPLGIFELVRSGQYDMGHSASYYWKGKVPNTLYFTSMPFGMTMPEQYGWFYFGEGMALMQEVYGKHNLLSFPGGNAGNQMSGWFQKEIKSLDDLKGLKIRIPGFAGEILAELGAKPTTIPGGELYTALERGTIDAVKWAAPALDLRMGFQKFTKYYYTGWQEPASELQFLVNKRIYNKLPEDLQEILRVAMRTAAYDMYIQSHYENMRAWSKMKEQYPHIEVRTLPKSVLTALRDTSDMLLQEKAKRNALAKRIIESQRAYMKEARSWTNISDRTYFDSLRLIDGK